eukprot:4046999-Pyramimonas_sp.AAC.1
MTECDSLKQVDCIEAELRECQEELGVALLSRSPRNPHPLSTVRPVNSHRGLISSLFRFRAVRSKAFSLGFFGLGFFSLGFFGRGLLVVGLFGSGFERL